MFINEIIQKRACCPHCGEMIPSIRRMNISIFRNIIVCPHCNSQLTLNKSILVMNLLLFFLIFPTLSFTFTRHHYFLGPLALLVLMSISLLVLYTAEYKIVSVNKKTPTQSDPET